MDGEKLKVILPNHLNRQSMPGGKIPAGYGLKNVLNQLKDNQGELSTLRAWEKSCYKAYGLGEIQDIILESYKEEWPCIIKTHLLSKDPDDLGANATAIYLIAYVAETYGTGKNIFSKAVKEMGITNQGKTAKSLWKVGHSDGRYLGVINHDGTIRDLNFFRKWISRHFKL